MNNCLCCIINPQKVKCELCGRHLCATCQKKARRLYNFKLDEARRLLRKSGRGFYSDPVVGGISIKASRYTLEVKKLADPNPRIATYRLFFKAPYVCATCCRERKGHV